MEKSNESFLLGAIYPSSLEQEAAVAELVMSVKRLWGRKFKLRDLEEEKVKQPALKRRLDKYNEETEAAEKHKRRYHQEQTDGCEEVEEQEDDCEEEAEDEHEETEAEEKHKRRYHQEQTDGCEEVEEQKDDCEEETEDEHEEGDEQRAEETDSEDTYNCVEITGVEFPSRRVVRVLTRDTKEPIYNEQGLLVSVRGKFGYSRDVTLKQWNGGFFVHINDYSKCWDSGTFDKSKCKSVSMKWENAKTLKDRLTELEQFAEQFQSVQPTDISQHQAVSTAHVYDYQNLPVNPATQSRSAQGRKSSSTVSGERFQPF